VQFIRLYLGDWERVTVKVRWSTQAWACVYIWARSLDWSTK